MLHNVTKATKIALNFHKSQNFFFSKEFLIDKEAGRAYSSFSRRDVAQSGSALEWGSRGRRFKSFHPDQHMKENYPKGISESWFPFLIVSPQKRLCQRISNAALHAPSAPFPFVLLKPRIGIFQRFLHRADNVPAGIPNPFASPIRVSTRIPDFPCSKRRSHE